MHCIRLEIYFDLQARYLAKITKKFYTQDDQFVPIHSKFPTILVKQSVKWKLEEFDKGVKHATKMARFLVDVLFERKQILNYSLDDLIKNEKTKMTFLLSYVSSFYKLNNLSSVRTAISDKLTHFKGRTKSTPKKKVDQEVASKAEMLTDDSPQTLMSDSPLILADSSQTLLTDSPLTMTDDSPLMSAADSSEKQQEIENCFVDLLPPNEMEKYM